MKKGKIEIKKETPAKVGWPHWMLTKIFIFCLVIYANMYKTNVCIYFIFIIYIRLFNTIYLNYCFLLVSFLISYFLHFLFLFIFIIVLFEISTTHYTVILYKYNKIYKIKNKRLRTKYITPYRMIFIFYFELIFTITSVTVYF